MKELNDEIKLTLNLMQADIDDGAHGELQGHLYSLLEIKRNELHQRLVENSWSEPVTHAQAPYISANLYVKITDEVKPLTTEELKAGGWWCADTSEECANAFKSKHLRVFNLYEWGCDGAWSGCVMDDNGDVTRGFCDTGDEKQIHRIGNDFYWSELNES